MRHVLYDCATLIAIINGKVCNITDENLKALVGSRLNAGWVIGAY